MLLTGVLTVGSEPKFSKEVDAQGWRMTSRREWLYVVRCRRHPNKEIGTITIHDDEVMLHGRRAIYGALQKYTGATCPHCLEEATRERERGHYKVYTRLRALGLTPRRAMKYLRREHGSS
jgi:hypothetical protein